jgi:hypothetical protein
MQLTAAARRVRNGPTTAQKTRITFIVICTRASGERWREGGEHAVRALAVDRRDGTREYGSGTARTANSLSARLRVDRRPARLRTTRRGQPPREATGPCSRRSRTKRRHARRRNFGAHDGRMRLGDFCLGPRPRRTDRSSGAGLRDRGARERTEYSLHFESARDATAAKNKPAAGQYA